MVNLNDMKLISDNKSQRGDKGIHNDTEISGASESRKTVPKLSSISDNVTSTDVRKKVTSPKFQRQHQIYC